MADYRRMVSYLYDYENGAKKNNVGYVKIEVRNGQCKTTIHLKCLSLSGKTLVAYLFLRKSGKMFGMFLGKVFLQGGTGDTRVIVPAEKMGKSPYGMNDMGGLVLLEDSMSFDSHTGMLKEMPMKFLGTEWDDNPIKIRDFCVWNESMENNKIEVSSEIEVIMPNNKLPDMKEIISHTEKVQLLNTEREKQRRQNLERERKEALVAANPLGETIGEKANEDAPIIEGWNTDVLKPQIKERTVVQAAELEKESPIVMEEGNVLEEEIEVKKEEVLKENNDNDLEQMQEEESQDFVPKEEILEQKELCEEEKRVETDTSLATQIFSNYPHMFPFEDDEVLECVRMEPQDIGVFPIEIWALANNSFLLHGYYSYRHLIFAKKQVENGEEYILGIPGIYHNRELFMAKMFGFESFKPIKKKDQSTGEFGYWYRPIMIT